MIKNIQLLFLVSLTIIACSKSEDTVDNSSSDGKALTAGSANFSKFVALGDSFTAGYSDNALFKAGQENAFPNIMAQQFSLVGGGAFTTPFMNDNLGGFNLGGVQFPLTPTRLYFNIATSLPANVPGNTTTSLTEHLSGSFGNLGVPGAKSYHLETPNYGNLAGVLTGSANPYFARFASAPTKTVLEDAIAQTPTFFSLWIGGNDVLGYALSGGTGVDQTGNPNPATYGASDITDPTVFAGVYNNLVNGLTASGAKGVVANVPYVKSIPFFTRVPAYALPGLPAANATDIQNNAKLNQLFAGVNGYLASVGKPARFVNLVSDDANASTVEANPVLITDETLDDIAPVIKSALMFGGISDADATAISNKCGKARHASNASATQDYILLSASTVIGSLDSSAPAGYNVIGVTVPLEDKYTLTADEVSKIKVATDAYNTTISGIAATKELAFVDTLSILDKVATGKYVQENYTMASTYVFGNSFSLDGVHASPRGYALIANEFIMAINKAYGSNMKGVKLEDYRILYPKLF